MRRVHIAQAAIAALFVTACLSVSPTATQTTGPTSVPPTATPTMSVQTVPTSAPTPTPTPAARPTTRPTPTPNPLAPASADEILATIVEFSQNEVPFAVDEVGSYSGEAGGQASAVDLEIAGDVQGADFSGQITLSQPGVTVAYDMVVSGDQSWIRPAGGDWQEVATTGQSQPLQPIRDLTQDDLSYVGVFYVAESRLPMHRIKVNRWTGLDFRDLGFRKPVLTLISFEIIANNAGYPQSVELDYRLVGRFAGYPFDLTYYLTYSMSDFGLPVTIEAPI